MTRVLVLGSSGRIGRMLRQAWALDSLRTPNADIELVFQTRQADQNRPEDLRWDILREPPQAVEEAARFDCMIVLSGVVPGPEVDFTLNTAIGTACVTAAAQLGIPHVLLASTSAVYGTGSDDPFSEDDPLDPANDYGRSKRDMEAACHALAAELGVGLCCLRIGNVAGADALLINGAALAPDEKLRLDTFKDGGTPVRSYIGPQSLARVMLSLVRNRTQLPAALNIAAPHAITMGALAQAAQMPLELHLARDSAHQYVTLDCGVLETLHRFDPTETHPSEMVRQWHMLR
ncbi:NAD-dependent epimerase/dehydratase family protein [Sulfitobacter sp.]|uniref:NAD-dependent epimerase/dehydratase family protein n=1 Tax=Sulfitobacter sp. TaxID=1903071 RepID=UPI0030030D12